MRVGIDSAERFEALFRQHEPSVLAYALRRAPTEIAKDAVSETFLAAWRRLDDLPDDPAPWLIATATLANQRRSAVRQRRLFDRLAVVAPRLTMVTEQMGEGASVRAALERLHPKDRETLLLISWDGLTPSQAAASLGCSAATFRVRLHRARRRLDHFLAQERGTAVRHPSRVAKEAPTP